MTSIGSKRLTFYFWVPVGQVSNWLQSGGESNLTCWFSAGQTKTSPIASLIRESPSDRFMPNTRYGSFPIAPARIWSTYKVQRFQCSNSCSIISDWEVFLRGFLFPGPHGPYLLWPWWPLLFLRVPLVGFAGPATRQKTGAHTGGWSSTTLFHFAWMLGQHVLPTNGFPH